MVSTEIRSDFLKAFTKTLIIEFIKRKSERIENYKELERIKRNIIFKGVENEKEISDNLVKEAIFDGSGNGSNEEIRESILQRPSKNMPPLLRGEFLYTSTNPSLPKKLEERNAPHQISRSEGSQLRPPTFKQPPLSPSSMLPGRPIGPYKTIDKFKPVPIQLLKNKQIPQPPRKNAPLPSIKTKSSEGSTPGLQKIIIKAFAKIQHLIDDETVQTIECPGPSKTILVYKGGAIQTTQITLTANEIAEIMKEISNRTKIPLISGIFKAAFDKLITTAVVSEFVGTRFIIQKRINPEEK